MLNENRQAGSWRVWDRLRMLAAIGFVGCSIALVLSLASTHNQREMPGTEPALEESAGTETGPREREREPVMSFDGEAQSGAPTNDLGQQPPDELNARLNAIQSQDRPGERTHLLDKMAASFSDEQLAAVLDQLKKSTNPITLALGQRLVRRWATSDPAAAASWLSTLAEGPWYMRCVEQVGIAWANSDASAAARWVSALPEDGGKAGAVLRVAYEAARSDPLTALEITGGLPPSKLRDAALVHAASQWGASDPDPAAHWAANVPEPGLRQKLIASIAIGSAAKDPEGAAAMVAGLIPPGAEQDRAAVAIVQRWAQTSPQSTADWVSQFPNAVARAVAAQNLAAIWVAQDAQGAAEWVRNSGAANAESPASPPPGSLASAAQQ